MSFPYADLQIQPNRLKVDFDTLAEIGSTGDGDAHRPAFSEGHLEARRRFHRTDQQRHLAFEVGKLTSHAPQPLHPQAQWAIRAAGKSLVLVCLDLASGAAHDALMMVTICPAGMIFTPSIGGFSHSHREETAWEDWLCRAQTLLQAALHMARGGRSSLL